MRSAVDDALRALQAIERYASFVAARVPSSKVWEIVSRDTAASGPELAQLAETICKIGAAKAADRSASRNAAAKARGKDKRREPSKERARGRDKSKARIVTPRGPSTGMTWKQAAEHMMRRELRPMSGKELARVCLKEGLIISNGKTPENTMSREMNQDIKVNEEASTFVRTAPGTFFLRDLWTERGARLV